MYCNAEPRSLLAMLWKHRTPARLEHSHPALAQGLSRRPDVATPVARVGAGGSHCYNDSRLRQREQPMAEVFPFQAYRFNPARVDLAKVLTQPYDKITPAMQERYYALASQNLIAVEKGKAYSDDTPANNVYTRAAQALKNWITQGALVRDAVPSIYIYLQDYQVPLTRERKVRKGFIALGRVEDYAGGVVFRHEQTLAGPRADRLELLRHTRV